MTTDNRTGRRLQRLMSAAVSAFFGEADRCLLCGRAAGFGSGSLHELLADSRWREQGDAENDPVSSNRHGMRSAWRSVRQRLGIGAETAFRSRDPAEAAAIRMLEPTLYALSRLLCRGCLRAVPWILAVGCERCGRAAECPDCVRRAEHPLEANRAAVSYTEEMKRWLASYKYRGNERLRSVLSLMLEYAYRRMEDGVRPDGAPASFSPLVTSVPLSRLRLAERGFDQAAQLASDLARRIRRPYVPLLQRIRHTERQSLKTRAERLKDLEGVFALTPEAAELSRMGQWAEKHAFTCILIVDDVYTTGSTLHECAKLLRQNFPVPVYGVTWAR